MNDKNYHCETCGRKYATKGHKKYHEFCGKESKEKPFQCDQCPQGFISKSHYKYHLKTHSGDKEFSCPHSGCDKRFIQPNKLTRHMLTHTMEMPFKCQVQGYPKKFRVAEALRAHIRTHTGERPFSCTQCEKAFSTSGGLKKHLSTHTEDKLFLCDLCGKSYGLKEKLMLHQKTHSDTRPFKCDHANCDKAFFYKKDLTRHALTHTDIIPFKCSICESPSRRRENLVRHIISQHGKTREVAEHFVVEVEDEQPDNNPTSKVDTTPTEDAIPESCLSSELEFISAQENPATFTLVINGTSTEIKETEDAGSYSEEIPANDWVIIGTMDVPDEEHSSPGFKEAGNKDAAETVRIELGDAPHVSPFSPDPRADNEKNITSNGEVENGISCSNLPLEKHEDNIPNLFGKRHCILCVDECEPNSAVPVDLDKKTTSKAVTTLEGLVDVLDVEKDIYQTLLRYSPSDPEYWANLCPRCHSQVDKYYWFKANGDERAPKMKHCLKAYIHVTSRTRKYRGRGCQVWNKLRDNAMIGYELPPKIQEQCNRDRKKRRIEMNVEKENDIQGQRSSEVQLSKSTDATSTAPAENVTKELQKGPEDPQDPPRENEIEAQAQPPPIPRMKCEDCGISVADQISHSIQDCIFGCVNLAKQEASRTYDKCNYCSTVLTCLTQPTHRNICRRPSSFHSISKFRVNANFPHYALIMGEHLLKFKCKRCPAFAFKLEDIKEHVKLHDLKEGFLCPTCSWLVAPGKQQEHEESQHLPSSEDTDDGTSSESTLEWNPADYY